MNKDEREQAIQVIEKDIVTKCERLLEVAMKAPETTHTINPSYYSFIIFVNPNEKTVCTYTGGFSYSTSTGFIEGEMSLRTVQKHLDKALPKLIRQVARKERKTQRELKSALEHCEFDIILGEFLMSTTRRIFNAICWVGIRATVVSVALLAAIAGYFYITIKITG